jgi:hypothetical protein
MSFLARFLSKKCKHYFSWPRLDSEGRYYQTCSRCGIAYEYDWHSMHRTDRLIVSQVVDSRVHPPMPRP